MMKRLSTHILRLLATAALVLTAGCCASLPPPEDESDELNPPQKVLAPPMGVPEHHQPPVPDPDLIVPE